MANEYIRGWTAANLSPNMDLHNDSLNAVDGHLASGGTWSSAPQRRPSVPASSPNTGAAPALPRLQAKLTPAVTSAIPAITGATAPTQSLNAAQLFQDRIKSQSATTPAFSLEPGAEAGKVNSKQPTTQSQSGWSGGSTQSGLPTLPGF